MSKQIKNLIAPLSLVTFVAVVLTIGVWMTVQKQHDQKLNCYYEIITENAPMTPDGLKRTGPARLTVEGCAETKSYTCEDNEIRELKSPDYIDEEEPYQVPGDV